MFIKRSLLFVLASASAIVAAPTSPTLELKVSGPNEVTDVANLKLVATITNTGGDTLKLLNDPRSVIHEFPTESFTIQHGASGASPKFIGARLKYVPAVAIKHNDSSSFTVLKPGESVNVTHDLSSAYDFSQTGAGKYNFLPSNHFLYVDPATSEATSIYAGSANSHQLSLSGSLTPKVTSSGLKSDASQATFIGCDAIQQAALNDAAAAAQDYASDASTYTNTHQNSTTRYVTWFGTYTDARHTTVQTHFNNVNGNDFSTYTYDCSTCVLAGTFAYVYPNTFGKVYLCPVFWVSPLTGTDSKGGTLVHEATHFTANGGTIDVRNTYGQVGCQALAKSSPDEAITNADNHEYYAENSPFLA